MSASKPCFKSELTRAVECFNAGDFFECHEVIEALWMTLKVGNPLKVFLQGWLQIAVGFYHWQQNNSVGARNLLLAGLSKLDTDPLQGNAWVASYDWLSLKQASKEQLDCLLEVQGHDSRRLKVMPDCRYPQLKALIPAKE